MPSNEPIQTTEASFRTAGLTIIELLISIAVGSIVLMMLMQMVVMNVAAKRAYEYENFVTDQNLAITDFIRKELIDLRPHHMIIEPVSPPLTVTFSHQYDIVYDVLSDSVIQTDASAYSEALVYDAVAQTLSYDGQILHAASIKILSAQFEIDYFDDVTYDPALCSDYGASVAGQICGDGILILTLEMAVLFNSGELGDSFTFTTHIVV